MLMDFNTLCNAVKGTYICTYCPHNGFDSVTTDSRQVRHAALFIPLRGTAQDGHRYIEQALQNGAYCVIADAAHSASKEASEQLMRLCKKHMANCIRVENTLHALQDAAACYAARFPQLLKIGVTGSNGKTTTKELLASIFTQKYRTVKNEGNLNSETGLPLSVFNISDKDEVGIFELGMNRKGEIAELAGVLKPSIAVITNIGTAHIGILGSKDAIAQEKKQIFSCFDDASVGFIPSGDEYAQFLSSISHGTIIPYYADPQCYTLEGLSGSTIRYKNETIRLSLPGVHNVRNAFAAIAVAEYCHIPLKVIKAGIEAAHSLFGRSQIVRESVIYLLDCYNANPDSMHAAMDLCACIKENRRKLYILGSMLELGAASDQAHRAVCAEAFSSDADILFFFGETICKAAREYGKNQKKPYFCYTENQAEKLSAHLDCILKRNDFVLLKGSRALALEQFEPVLQKERT